LIQKELKSEPL